MHESYTRITLPGYLIQLNQDCLSSSRTKLKEAAQELIYECNINPSVIKEIPCSNENETIDYRCSCSFQIILDESHTYQYAMRTHGIPVGIGADLFPIATPRIQQVMKVMIECLNQDKNKHSFNLISSDLSSASFVSSWNPSKDCIVTLNYSKKIKENDIMFLNQLNDLRSICNITTLIARSKKIKVQVGRLPPSIEDDLWLIGDENDSFHISLVGSRLSDVPIQVGRNRKIIHYSKPEDAFQHPNGNTMIQALDWMINILASIKHEMQTNSSMGKLQLLEMYCGCGAHTIAISKANIFDYIIAIEMDPRLVDACAKNIQTNGCSPLQEESFTKSTPIRVFQGDAGTFAANSLRNMDIKTSSSSPNSKSYWQHQRFQVLLVDPPRGGLDEHVINLGMNGTFEHIIYISCGKDALVRDLKVLSSTFEVVNCTLTDLFPRTDSVETLVHLRRKR